MKMLRTAKVLPILALTVIIQQVISFDDDKCDDQLIAFTDSITAKELWALRLFDFWGKIEAGYMFGNLKSIGRFNECLNFTETVKDVGTVQGQHCMISWTLKSMDAINGIMGKFPGNLSSIEKIKDSIENPVFGSAQGVCLPATCCQEKVIEFVNVFLNSVNMVAFKARCQTRDPLPLDGFDITTISLLAIFGILLMASTAYDLIIRRSKDREPHKLLIAFSVYTNGQQLFKVYRNKPSKSIDCLEGLRCISLFCMIFIHRFTHNHLVPTTNSHENMKRIKFYWIALLLWQEFCIDTFLVIAGFLCSMQFLKAFDTKNFNFFKMMIHRYMRYTPVLAASIFIFTSLFRHVKGPVPDVDGLDECRRYWWSALLHLQNYINPKEICPGHAWYLSVDFQLFLLSPLVIYPARQYGWKYLWNLPALAILSSIYVMMVFVVHKYQGVDLILISKEYNRLYHFPTHTRVTPWLIGMVIGYVIYESRSREIKMKKALVWLLWMLSLLAGSALICLNYIVIQIEDNQTTLLQTATFKAFSHLIWSLFIIWIIFACYKLKSGGIIRWFVSLPEWQPLGRLSLSIYVTSFFYQRYTFMNEKTSFTLEVIPVMIKYLGDIIAAVAISIVFWLTFETPSSLIEQYLQNRPKQKIYKLSDCKMKTDIRTDHDVASL